MNSIYSAYIVLPRNELCGRNFLYQYACLPDDESTEKFIAWQSEACSKICKNITKNTNKEWVFRQYMAAKMILAASLSTQSFVYCESVNARLPIYHLQYNALQYCCRALIFSNAYDDKCLDSMISETHTKIINKSIDILARFDKKLSSSVKLIFNMLKGNREILTYKAPTSGDKILLKCDIVPVLKVICELAQLESEVFEQSYSKHVIEKFSLDITDAPDGLYTYKCANNTIIDQEDWYRIDYIGRKYPRPMSIRLYMTEGWVEDFFGAWANYDSENDNEFRPDENWQIIFDIP